ncbi:MAG: DUF805 domain-containing protein [Limisphaerales bacterium]
MKWVFKIYFRFSGRIPRSTYWLASIPIGLLAIVAQIYDEQDWSTVLTLVLIWPSLAIYAKRWHDRDKSGWWSLIILIPLIGTIWSLVECGFLRGTDGPNRFGASVTRSTTIQGGGT